MAASPGDRPTGSGPDAPRVYAVTEPDRPRIVAVVVTFNRLELLQRLVGRLPEVDRLAEVVVVDNASTDGTGEWLRTAAAADDAGRAAPARPQPRRRRRLPRGAAAGGRARRRPGVADGRRRPARPRLPRPAAGPRGQPGLLGTGRRRRGRPRPAGLPDPAAGRHPGRPRHRLGRAGGDRRAAARRRHPVQRGAGHPRAGAADRLPPRGVLHLGRRPRVPAARRARGGPDRHRRGRPGPAPLGRRAGHADDARADDVQPQPERPQALLHGPQQHPQPARLPRLAARADVLGQDAVVLHVHPAATAPARAERAGASSPACAATSPATRGSCGERRRRSRSSS